MINIKLQCNMMDESKLTIVGRFLKLRSHIERIEMFTIVRAMLLYLVIFSILFTVEDSSNSIASIATLESGDGEEILLIGVKTKYINVILVKIRRVNILYADWCHIDKVALPMLEQITKKKKTY